MHKAGNLFFGLRLHLRLQRNLGVGHYLHLVIPLLSEPLAVFSKPLCIRWSNRRQEFKIPKIKIPKIKIPMIKIPKGGIKIPTEGSKYQWGYQNTNGGIKIPNRGYQNTK